MITVSDAPLQLRTDGLSVGGTGLAMSGSSLVFVVCSALVAGRARLMNLRFVAFAALAYAATLVLAALSASAPSILTFVLVRAPFWAVLSTLSYPLGALGARRAAAGCGGA